MNFPASPRFLPALLWADAASAGLVGVLQVAAAPALARWLGLPQALLLASGAFLLAVAVFAAWLARARPPRRGAVLALVGVNAGWVLGCLELLFTGAAGTALGVAYLALQVLAVGALAELEWLGLRRKGATALA